MRDPHDNYFCLRVPGDEEDGYDETLIPVDFKQAGQIVDDDILKILVRFLLRIAGVYFDPFGFLFSEV